MNAQQGACACVAGCFAFLSGWRQAATVLCIHTGPLSKPSRVWTWLHSIICAAYLDPTQLLSRRPRVTVTPSTTAWNYCNPPWFLLPPEQTFSTDRTGCSALVSVTCWLQLVFRMRDNFLCGQYEDAHNLEHLSHIVLYHFHIITSLATWHSVVLNRFPTYSPTLELGRPTHSTTENPLSSPLFQSSALPFLCLSFT